MPASAKTRAVLIKRGRALAARFETLHLGMNTVRDKLKLFDGQTTNIFAFNLVILVKDMQSDRDA